MSNNVDFVICLPYVFLTFADRDNFNIKRSGHKTFQIYGYK